MYELSSTFLIRSAKAFAKAGVGCTGPIKTMPRRRVIDPSSQATMAPIECPTAMMFFSSIAIEEKEPSIRRAISEGLLSWSPGGDSALPGEA